MLSVLFYGLGTIGLVASLLAFDKCYCAYISERQ